MIIAQCPGAEEVNHEEIDENQEHVLMPIPLCGKTGRQAHKWFNWLGFVEGEYILTNIIKHTCTEMKTATRNRQQVEIEMSRPPTQEEIFNGLVTLKQEIAKVDPQFIITLGKEALWGLLYTESVPLEEFYITRYCGKLHEYKYDINEILYKIPGVVIHRKVQVLPLLHPSAVLRDLTSTSPKGYKETVTKILQENKSLIEEILGRISI